MIRRIRVIQIRTCVGNPGDLEHGSVIITWTRPLCGSAAMPPKDFHLGQPSPTGGESGAPPVVSHEHVQVTG
jgi:hypothetical protein